MRKTRKPIIIMPLPIMHFGGDPPTGDPAPPDNGDG